MLGLNHVAQMLKSLINLIRRVEEFDHHRQVHGHVQQYRGMYLTRLTESGNAPEYGHASHLLFIVQTLEEFGMDMFALRNVDPRNGYLHSCLPINKPSQVAKRHMVKFRTEFNTPLPMSPCSRKFRVSME